MDSPRENHEKFIKNNKLILKSQQRCRSEKHNVFIGEITKIVLSTNDDKRIQSISRFSRNICIWNEQKPIIKNLSDSI